MTVYELRDLLNDMCLDGLGHNVILPEINEDSPFIEDDVNFAVEIQFL